MIKPEEITELRNRMALSREEFARLLKVSSKSVKAWEDGSALSDTSEQKIRRIEQMHNSGQQISAGGDVHHINSTESGDALELLKKQQELTAEAMAQNAKLIGIIEKLTK